MTDHRKKFIHMEDNEDGTFTMTMYMGDLIGEVTVVSKGDIEQVIMGLGTTADPEAIKQFMASSVLIPNEVEP